MDDPQDRLSFASHQTQDSTSVSDFTSQALEASGVDEVALFERVERAFRDRLGLERLVSASPTRALFVAVDTFLKRRVAMRVHLNPGSESRLWFERETELMAVLDHPSIRPVYSAGREGDWAFRIGKWVEGESLREAVERGPRPIPSVLHLARDLLSAVEYAHSKQVVLRRIIPATVIVDRFNRAIITDLRFANRCLEYAKVEHDPSADHFLAPETWHGHAGQQASDVYAVGALLYYAITGLPPETNPNEITPPRQIRVNTPVVLEHLIMRALQADPMDRYLNAAEMADDLRTYWSGDDIVEGALASGKPTDDPEGWEKRLRRALGDEYELLDELGTGGFGSVYRVRDLRLEREVALKVLHPYLTSEPALVERFRREAQLAAQLKHPNIVSIYDIGSRGGLIWYTMAHVQGGNLASVVREEGPLPLVRLMFLLDEALDALMHAHRRGIVHRDLKPENLLIDSSDGSLQITDLGLAMALHGARYGGASSHSGTPAYAAPEQLLGEVVDHRADLYSLSVVAFFALTGVTPFGGGTVESILARQALGDLPDIRHIRDDVPEAVIDVLARGAARNPEDRYPSAEAYAGALRASMRGWWSKPKTWLRGLFRDEGA